MTPDPYRTAYDKALTDLTGISDEFEQLLNRKRRVENLVAALQPIFAPDQQSSAATSAIVETSAVQGEQETPAEAGAETETRYSFLDVPAPLPESDGNPFERRTRAGFHFRGLSVQR